MTPVWHIRATSRLKAEVEDIAHREGRSVASAIRRFIEEAVQARSKLPASVFLPERFDEKEAFRNSILVRNVPHHLKQALQEFCRAEDRSMTNATRVLLAEGLKRHGYLHFAALATDSDEVEPVMIAGPVLLALNDAVEMAVNVKAFADLIAWGFVTATYDGDSFLSIEAANPSRFPPLPTAQA